jgi:hypothetical protein
VEVHEQECSLLARDFFDRICRDEGIGSATSTVLHSDNGAPQPQASRRVEILQAGGENERDWHLAFFLQATGEQ